MTQSNFKIGDWIIGTNKERINYGHLGKLLGRHAERYYVTFMGKTDRENSPKLYSDDEFKPCTWATGSVWKILHGEV